jgi:hypothetical protein
LNSEIEGGNYANFIVNLCRLIGTYQTKGKNLKQKILPWEGGGGAEMGDEKYDV